MEDCSQVRLLIERKGNACWHACESSVQEAIRKYSLSEFLELGETFK